MHSVNIIFRESETVLALSIFHTPEKLLIATKEQTCVLIWQQSTGKIIKVAQNPCFSASITLKLNLLLVKRETFRLLLSLLTNLTFPLCVRPDSNVLF